MFRWSLPRSVLKATDLPWTQSATRNHAIGCIIAEALAAHPTNRDVSFSLNRNFYNPAKAMFGGGGGYTYTHVRGAVAALETGGWIEVERAEQKIGGTGRQSVLRATGKALTVFGQCRPLYRLHDPIILRNAEGEAITPPASREIERIRRNIFARNEAISGVDIRLGALDVEWTPDAPMQIDGASYDPRIRAAHAVYNETTALGGRLYGLPYQTLNNRDHGRRSQLLMDGHAVEEPDFGGCHPRILYHERGIDPDGDLYDVAHPRYGRAEAKIAVQVLLNATSEKQGIPALAWKLARDDAKEAEKAGETKWSVEDIDARARNHLPDVVTLFDALTDKHDPIRDALFTGAGRRCQAVESRIMMRAGMDCLRKGIVALPMHDSAIAKAGREASILREAMVAAWVSVTARQPIVG